MIPVEISRQIAARILEAKQEGSRRLSADGTALLLYADIGGECYLRPDGEILSHSVDIAISPRRETDAGFRTMALMAGSDLYPELKALLPDRPASSRDCRTCSAGRIQLGDQSVICGECNGLGWQPGS